MALSAKARPVGFFVPVAVLTFLAATARGAAEGPTVPAARPAVMPRVLDPDGKAVAGATVSFVEFDRQAPLGQVITTTTTTAADGSFRLLPSRAPAGDDAPGARTQHLMIEAAGFGLTSASIDPDNPRDVRLNAATELRIRLLGPDGKPVAGVRVGPRILVARAAGTRFPAWSLLIPDGAQGRLARASDGNGRLVLPGLPRGASVQLNVLDDERFAQLTYADAVPLAAAAVTDAEPIRLRPGATIAGRLAYADTGKPAAGAVIHAQGVDLTDTRGWGSAATGADGSYRITRLGPGTYNLYVMLPEPLEKDWAVAAREKVAVGVGAQLRGEDLKLVKGGLLTGKVIDARTKIGLPGLSVGLHGPARPRSSAGIQSTRTDAEGAFKIRVPPGSQYVYLAQSPPDGYLQPPNQGGKDVEVPDGETIAVAVELSPDGRPGVAGRVLRPDGKPGAGATVFADPGQQQQRVGGAFDDTRWTRSAADGRFRFAGVAPGARLRARLGDAQTASAVEVKGGEQDLTLRLRDNTRASLLVTVKDANGNPVPGARIQLLVKTGDLSIGSSDPGRVTDANGQYVLENLAPDEQYSLWIEADDFGIGHGQVKPLKPGKQNIADPIVLAGATAAIAGRVVSKTGEALANIPVEINGSETGHRKTRSDARGRFRFAVVPGAAPLIFMRNDDGQSVGAKSVRAGQEEVELVFDPSATLK
jgi:hypothetical protein